MFSWFGFERVPDSDAPDSTRRDGDSTPFWAWRALYRASPVASTRSGWSPPLMMIKDFLNLKRIKYLKIIIRGRQNFSSGTAFSPEYHKMPWVTPTKCRALGPLFPTKCRASTDFSRRQTHKVPWLYRGYSTKCRVVSLPYPTKCRPGMPQSALPMPQSAVRNPTNCRAYCHRYTANTEWPRRFTSAFRESPARKILLWTALTKKSPRTAVRCSGVCTAVRGS